MNLNFYGNELATQLLAHTIEKNKLNHAYLIYGEKGLGKTTFAKRFAMSVLCGGEPKPCFQCSACKKIMANTHPDVKIILGGESKNSVHIEEIRAIRADCAIRPNESEYKIYIVTNIQNMTIGAFNAFLKTLEEPPKHALFLLTAPNIDSLPATIISRLSPIELFPLTHSELSQVLELQFPDCSENDKRSAMALAQGNLGQAIACLSDEEFQSLQQDCNKICSALLQKKEYELLCLFSAYEKNKMKLKQLFDCMNRQLREALFFRLHAQSQGSELAQKLGNGFTSNQLISLIEFFEQAKQKLATNANMTLLVAYFCTGIKRLIL